MEALTYFDTFGYYFRALFWLLFQAVRTVWESTAVIRRSICGQKDKHSERTQISVGYIAVHSLPALPLATWSRGRTKIFYSKAFYSQRFLRSRLSHASCGPLRIASEPHWSTAFLGIPLHFVAYFLYPQRRYTRSLAVVCRPNAFACVHQR